MNSSSDNYSFGTRAHRPSLQNEGFSRLKRRPLDRGQDLVEFVIILPVLLLILLGVVDLGRLFFAAITMTNAAREGARYGTFHPDVNANIKQAAINEAASSGITLNTGMVSANCPCASGTPVIVTITYQFDLIISNILPFNSFNIVRTAEMLAP